MFVLWDVLLIYHCKFGKLFTTPPHQSLFPAQLCPKGQVTRAQEAEENYLIKRELTTIKQQSDEASAKLEKAQNAFRELQEQRVRRLAASSISCSSLLNLHLIVHAILSYFHL